MNSFGDSLQVLKLGEIKCNEDEKWIKLIKSSSKSRKKNYFCVKSLIFCTKHFEKHPTFQYLRRWV